MNTAETYYIITRYTGWYNRKTGAWQPTIFAVRTNEDPRTDAIRPGIFCFNAQKLLKNGKWTKGFNFYLFDRYREVTKEEAEAL